MADALVACARSQRTHTSMLWKSRYTASLLTAYGSNMLDCQDVRPPKLWNQTVAVLGDGPLAIAWARIRRIRRICAGKAD